MKALRLVFALALAACSLAPHAGQAPSPSPSTSAVVLDQLGKVILTYNNQQAYWVGGVTQWSVAAKGVTVNKLDPAGAAAESQALEASVPSSAPMSIPLALLASESVLDRYCKNGNFAGSNPTKDPWGFDDGIAQLKLKYIEVNGKVGAAAFASSDDAQAFAFDAAKAVPYFWGIYNAHLATADAWIAAGGPSGIDPRLMNRWILAAVIYKQGDTGAYSIFKDGAWPAELNNFVSLEGYFAGKLGVKSVFAGI